MPPINTAFKIDAFKTMQERLQEYFKNEKVLQLFGRFATYNGSNPYQIPATLNIIPHVEFTMGSYYVKGGMYNIVESLQNIMKDMGINIFLNTQITEILHDRVAVNGIRVGEEVINYDRVVANSDVVYTFSTMIKGFPDYTIKLRKLEPSLSGMLFHWGVKGRHEQLALHNVFFSDDYKKEFDSIFHSHTHPSSPTIYVSVSSKIDSNHAPDGCENWYVLLNMPYHSGQDWESATQQVRYSVLSDLKTHGIDISDKIECEDVFTPLDFKNKYFSNRGSIYGISSNSMMAAFQRPANRSRLLKNLYFTGGSSHPGGGVPLVILSGRHAAKIIALEDGINFQDFESGEYKRLVVML
jgi:phytoene desaturase